MAGSREGGLYTRDMLLEKYGPDYYRFIGQIGGRKSRTGGFYGNRALARRAGALGGHRSSRAKVGNGKSKTKKQREFDRVHKHLLNIGARAKRERERAERADA